MTSDETYYWVWSYHPQLNYYDHPSMVAWLYLLGHPLENFGSMVRWPGIFLSHATLYLWMVILKDHLRFNDKQILSWLWLALLTPLFGAGALIITPDIPLMFFWTLALLCFLKLLGIPSQFNGFTFGVALGLGLISKYMIVLLPLSILVAALFKKEWWFKVLPKQLAIFIGFVFGAIPFILWNIDNDWISIRFQLDHGLGGKVWKPSWTIEYVLLQIGIIFPPILYLVIKGIKKSPAWLVSLAWTPLLFFFFTSFRGYVEANWPIAAYPSILAMAVLGGGERFQKATRLVWGALLIGAFTLISTQYSPFEKPIKTKEFFEFEELYEIARVKSPLYVRSYQMASRLSFETKKMIYKLRGFNRKDSYDFWEGSKPTDHFYLILNQGESLPEGYFELGYRIANETLIGERFQLLEIKKSEMD